MNTRTVPHLLALASLLPASLHAGDAASKALAADLVAKHGAAMVTVEAIIEIQPKVLEAPEELRARIPALPKTEQRATSQGLVIDPSGIIAVPLAAINPAAVMAAGVERQTQLGPIKIGADSAFLTVTVIDAEGAEHDAKLALQDERSGLALVQLVEKPAAGWTAVEPFADSAPPEAFGPLIQMSRLGADLDRTIMVRRSRFVQELRIPGLFYELTGFVGAPGFVGFAAFGAEAQFVGVGVLPLGFPLKDIASTGVVLLPAARILPLLEKVRSARK